MRIASITITNLAAFKEFKTSLGGVNIVSGKHGIGKSSLERAVMYALGRRPMATKGSRSVQHDPTMLHGTADKGEILITFTEDSPAELLRCVVRTDTTSRQVKMRGSKKWEDAAAFIDDVTSALAYDPMQFKDLAPKERLEAFLRVVPVEISREEITTAVGGVIPIGSDTPGLETINGLYEDIYKLRTSENTAADTQSKHADQLEAALPPAAVGGDWNAEVSRLRGEKGKLETSESEEIKRIGKDLQAKKDSAAGVRQKTSDAIDKALFAALDEIDAKIKELEDQKTAAKTEAGSAKTAALQVESDAGETARNAANAEAKEIRDANAPLHAKLLTDIATADERSRGTAQAEGTRKAAKVAREEAEGRKGRSKALTEALDRLTALKAAVGGRMKVKGVTIAAPREGQPVDLCREEDGALIPFSVWNSASQDQFCLRIAVLYRGSFGLVCVDNMANFSEGRREEVVKTCKRYAESDKMQFLLGWANESDELKVVEA